MEGVLYSLLSIPHVVRIGNVMDEIDKNMNHPVAYKKGEEMIQIIKINFYVVRLQI